MSDNTVVEMKYKTINELYEGVNGGAVDESKLEIILDNDNTGFYIKSDDEHDVLICEGNGDYDVEELYRLLFPKAMVDRC